MAELVQADPPLNRVAIVVPAATERQLGNGVQEHLARPAPAPPSLDLGGNAVDALLKPEIVHLEAGRDELAGDAPVPRAADAIEKHVAGGPRERGTERVVAEAPGVGALVVAAGGLLRRIDSGGVAADRGAAEARGQGVGVVTPAVEEIHPARVGGAAEHVERPRVEVTIHGGSDEADGGVAVAQVAFQTAHEVIGERLHLVAMPEARGRIERRRPLPARERVQDTDRPAIRPPAAQLRRAEDGAVRGGVGELSVGGDLPLIGRGTLLAHRIKYTKR